MNGTDLLEALRRIDPNKFAETDQKSNPKSTESNASEENQK